MIDHKDRPDFYDKPKPNMTKIDHGIYWVIAGSLFLGMCAIFIILEVRFQ